MSERGLFKSPLNQRRWRIFRSNRRGFWSFIIFSIFFVLSLFAEFIANDKPIVVRYDQQWFFPVVNSYTETDFDGEFELEADYRDPYLIELINSKGWMLWFCT